MTSVLRWIVVAVLAGHGLLHVVAVVKGSEIAIVSSWSDAKFGTEANLVLAAAAVFGFASLGPTSFHAQYRDLAAAAFAEAAATQTLVTGDDIASLPEPLAAYIRRSGALGKPRVTSFSANPTAPGLQPPGHGPAPGWAAGLTVAARTGFGVPTH